MTSPSAPRGYRLFFTSEMGANSPQTLARGLPMRRIAIKRQTDLASFRRFATADRAVLRRAAVIASVKHLARRIVGNRLYQRLYERLPA